VWVGDHVIQSTAHHLCWGLRVLDLGCRVRGSSRRFVIRRTRKAPPLALGLGIRGVGFHASCLGVSFRGIGFGV